MNRWDPTKYAPIPEHWFRGDELNELGPGHPIGDVCREIEQSDPRRWLARQEPVCAGMAKACQAGLLLRNDGLDASHRISQTLESPTGAYWHGIMHRREPDPSNAKYWFRRVGDYPTFAALLESAIELASNDSSRVADRISRWSTWDPYEFIDICEEARSNPDRGAILCRRIALAGWQILFDHCYWG